MRAWPFALGVALVAVQPAVAEEATRATPEETLKGLLEGNARYTSSQLSSCKRTDPSVREALATGQRPAAIILSCSDSRVPPELVFDQTLGDLFVVRVAGNVPDPVVLGSIEYAAENLGSPLIMVLGHERCGAVTAAVDAKGHPSGNLGAILTALGPAVAQAKREAAGKDKAELVDVAITDNVKGVAASLTRRSATLAKLVKEGAVRIVSARYDLDDGRVSVLDAPAVAASPPAAGHGHGPAAPAPTPAPAPAPAK
jgi:carbonic anhydrase